MSKDKDKNKDKEKDKDKGKNKLKDKLKLKVKASKVSEPSENQTAEEHIVTDDRVSLVIEEDIPLEEIVYKLLKKYDLTISTAESCTGGMIGSKLVNVPGISEFYTYGFITYSNKAKRKILGVNRDTLKKYSAVSKEVAKEMVKGCLFEADSDVAIAVTGYAGPEDSKDEPKGLVYIAVAVGTHVKVQEFHFEGDRLQIRESATNSALSMVQSMVIEYYNK